MGTDGVTQREFIRADRLLINTAVILRDLSASKESRTENDHNKNKTTRLNE